MQTAMPAQPQCSSSLIISSVRKSRLWPPYSSGKKAAGVRPSLCAFLTASYGNSSVSSWYAATGRISFSANSCASCLIASCSWVSEKSSGIRWLNVLCGGLRQNRLATLVDRAELELARCPRCCGEGDSVARNNHRAEPALKPAQVGASACGFRGDGAGDPHLQHSVCDAAWQPDRTGEVIVEMYRIVVAGDLRIRRNLV